MTRIEPQASTPSAWAQRLGYAGLLPFAMLAVGIWLLEPSQRGVAGMALNGYGAVITSFLGAIHWGMVLRDMSKQSLAQLGWGVTPSLLAWFALMLSPPIGLLVTSLVLWVCFAADRMVYPRFHVQGWLSMRLLLTCVASGSCIVGAAGLCYLDKTY